MSTSSRGRGGHGNTAAVYGFQERRPCGVLLELCDEIFSLYEHPGILVQYPFRNPKSIAGLASENVLGLVSWSLFIGGGVTYPPPDEVLMSL